MPNAEPVAELHPGFSSPGATAISWTEARSRLEEAQIYWLTTVRPDGRPHVAPLLCVWLERALYLCTGPDERKAQNLAQNPHCIVTTGTNTFEGVDLVIEGDAVRVSDDARLRRIATAFELKYGGEWRYAVRDGYFYHTAGSVREEHTGQALVFEIAPEVAFGFGRGAEFSQTRYRF